MIELWTVLVPVLLTDAMNPALLVATIVVFLDEPTSDSDMEDPSGVDRRPIESERSS